MESQELLLTDLVLVSATEIASSSGLSPQDVEELVELGVIEPRAREPTPLFPASCIDLARQARRLQAGFDLPIGGVALALMYRRRIRELEEQLRRLRCEMPLHPSGAQQLRPRP